MLHRRQTLAVRPSNPNQLLHKLHRGIISGRRSYYPAFTVFGGVQPIGQRLPVGVAGNCFADIVPVSGDELERGR